MAATSPELRRQHGQRLRQGRIRASLTQTQLAKRLKVKQQTLSAWELGRSAMSDRSKIAIGRVLEQQPDVLFPLAPTATGGEAGPPLLSSAQAADYLGVSERTVKKLWAERRLAGVKIGRLVRFRPMDLDAYVASNRVEAVR